MAYKSPTYPVADMALMSLKSVAKLLLQGRHATIRPAADRHEPLVVMGNGPSLRTLIDQHLPWLQSHDTMAVNFAANADEFAQIRPRYYVLADPHFFAVPSADANVERLWQRLAAVDWPLTLLVPVGAAVPIAATAMLTIERYHAVGVEGWPALERWAYSHRRGMPRPRNVLIPSLMCGAWLGYRQIAIVGADHTWSQTLGVDDDNQVVNFQAHFYADGHGERQRVASVYRDVPLHSVFESFMVAFRSYHHIERWARQQGIKIVNATPQSMIDAFDRVDISDI